MKKLFKKETHFVEFGFGKKISQVLNCLVDLGLSVSIQNEDCLVFADKFIEIHYIHSDYPEYLYFDKKGCFDKVSKSDFWVCIFDYDLSEIIEIVKEYTNKKGKKINYDNVLETFTIKISQIESFYKIGNQLYKCNKENKALLHCLRLNKQIHIKKKYSNERI
jgi:hypothetical protein